MGSACIANAHIYVFTRLLERTRTLTSDAGDAQVKLASFYTSTPLHLSINNVKRLDLLKMSENRSYSSCTHSAVMDNVSQLKKTLSCIGPSQCYIHIWSCAASKPRRITNRICFTARVSTHSRSSMTVLVSPSIDCCAKSPECHCQLPHPGGTVHTMPTGIMMIAAVSKSTMTVT